MLLPGWVEIVLRSLSAFVILLVASKFFVRKAIAHFSFFEATSMQIVGVILAIGSFQLSVPIAYPITAIILWFIIIGMVNYLCMKSLSFRNFIMGKGVPVIKDGKVLEENLKKQRYTTDELLKQLRSKNVFKVADVEFAVLEASGDINVFLKKENQPLTAKDMSIPVPSLKQPETVVMDGKVIDEALATSGLNRAWLEQELEKQGIAIENVFLGQVDSLGELTIDVFDDKLKVSEPKEKQLLLAAIKKSHADLSMFALQTENELAKNMYNHCAAEIMEVFHRTKKYLQ